MQFRLPIKFARRYVFSKKNTNAINIISSISVVGIAFGSMALIVILSVFNGFEDLLGGLISSFKPDVQVTAVEGKVFVPDSTKRAQLLALDEIKSISETLEEIALFEYFEVQHLGRIKGVDAHFNSVTALDTMLKAGKYKTRHETRDVFYAVMGVGLSARLGVLLDERIEGGSEPIYAYMPKRKKRYTPGSMSQPFRQRSLYPIAEYAIQYEYDNYIVTDLEFVQELLAYREGEVSAWEIKLQNPARSQSAIAKIREILGDDFHVRDRYQQDEAFYKITAMEKWVGYLIFAFTLVLVAFNMVGALSMLILDKKKDIAMLKSMGATDGLVRRIFLSEGLLLSLLGVGIGFSVAIILCLAQQEFGLIRLQGEGAFIVDAYPVSLRFGDFILVLFTVLGVGLLASWLPAARAAKLGNTAKQKILQ